MYTYCLSQLHEVYSRLCTKRQVGGVAQGECLSLCSLLESRGIFALRKAKEARLTKVRTTQRAVMLASIRQPLWLAWCHPARANIGPPLGLAWCYPARASMGLPLGLASNEHVTDVTRCGCSQWWGEHGSPAVQEMFKEPAVFMRIQWRWPCVCLQVFLKIEERDVENALKDRTLLGSILEAGLPWATAPPPPSPDDGLKQWLFY